MEDKVGCGACEMTGWIRVEREGGQLVVRPCTCRYEIARKAMMIETAQTVKKLQERKAAEQIVRAYERHREKEKKDE